MAYRSAPSSVIAVRRALALGTTLGAGLLVSACGGGGGGPVATPSSTPVPVAPTPTPGTGTTTPAPAPTTPSAEYVASAGAAAANAGYAYDHGITGKSVTVAIVDSGIDTGSAEFAGRVSPDSTAFPITYASCSTCAPQTVTFDLQDVEGHGTMVADVAAGAKNGFGIEGVAYDATILALKIGDADIDHPDASGRPTEGKGVNAFAIAPAIAYAVDHGAFAINLSVNGQNTGTAATNERTAMDKVRAADRLLVESVSNATGDDSFAPGTIAQNLVGSDLANKNWFLFAKRLDTAGNPIAGDGTPGALADRTLSVVANGVTAVGLGGQLMTVSGNSFAAPVVAGAATLLKQYWPQLGGAEIARILLDTATDKGAVGPDQDYGAGVLDIQKAMQAQAPTVGLSAASAVPLAGSSLTFGPAFGGAGAGRTFASQAGSLVSLDRYGRDYRVPVTALTSGTAAGGIRLYGAMSSPLAMAMPAPAGPASALVATGEATSAHPSVGNGVRSFAFALSSRTTMSGQVGGDIEESALVTGAMLRPSGLATQGQSVAVMTGGMRVAFGMATSSRADGAAGTARSTTQRFAVEWPGGLRLGMTAVHEDGAALGLAGTGAFRVRGADSSFATVGWAGAIGGFRLTGDAMLGTTRAQGGSDLMRFLGPMLSSGFRVTADHAALGGLATLGLTSPLHVERARVGLTLPTGYDLAAASLVTGTRRLDLAPAAREMDLELGWTAMVARHASLRLSAAHAFDAGQTKGATSDAGFLTLALR